MYKIALDVCVGGGTGGFITSAECRLPHAASFALFIMQPSPPLIKIMQIIYLLHHYTTPPPPPIRRETAADEDCQFYFIYQIANATGIT